MTKFVYYTATTLDGYLADENDSLDWLFTQEQETGGAFDYEEFIADIGALAMGATTYQWVLDHNATTGEHWSYTQPSFVFTHRDLPAAAANVTFLQGPPGEHREALLEAAGDKSVWVVGGGDLAAQFAEAGMLDELMLSIAPVTLGAGRPLFPRRFDLSLVEHARNGAFLCARYAVRGPLAQRDQPRDEPSA